MYWTSVFYVAVTLTTGARGLALYGGPYKGPPVVPVVLEGGFLADTREVAAAKDYHLNVLAKHAQAVKGGGQGVSPYQYQQRSAYQPYLFKPQPVYTQAQPYTTSLYYNTGTARNTPYSAPVNEDTSRQLDDVDYADFSYTTRRPDPMVTPRVLDNGYIADTPEVDAAKGEHFAAVARAKEMVTLAQQRAGQDKAMGGYSGGDPTGYTDEYRAEYSGADYTGFPEYRSDPGYSIRDRTSAGYSEDYPSPSAMERSELESYPSPSGIERSAVASSYPSRSARERSAVEPYPSRSAKERSSVEPYPSRLARERSAVEPYPSRSAREHSAVEPYPSRSAKERSSVEPYPTRSVRERSAVEPYQGAREAALTEPSSNYPIRDRILAEAKSNKERSLVKTAAAKKASVAKNPGKATASTPKKPVEVPDY